jgi:ABC-type transport system involved in cytochrome bd biosynthesis fused ATPase/permease subunit
MRVRNRVYFALMALCLALFVLSWAVVRLYSVTAAVVMSVVAIAIPPIAVIIVNAGDEASRRRQ